MDRRIWKELKRRAKGDQSALTMWRAYLAFLNSRPALAEKTPGTTTHHILWRSEYPRFVSSGWNLIRLAHEDHTAAAALMLAAEPGNLKLFNGFKMTSIIPGRTSWTPKNKAKVIALYTDRFWSIKKIAKKVGVSEQTIARFLKRSGVRVRLLEESMCWNPKPKEAKRIISLYTERHHSTVYIGKKFGVNDETVWRFLRRKGIKTRSRKEILKWEKQWRPRKPQEVIRLYERGVSPTQIARRFGVSRSCLYTFLKRHKVRIRTISEWRAWQPKNPDEIIALYVKQCWSSVEIGEKFGVGHSAVTSFLKQKGVAIRRNGEGREWQPRNPSKILELYKLGWSSVRIGCRFGVGQNAVLNFIRRSGGTVRRFGETRKELKPAA
jgi:transposase-like protein